VIDVVDLAAAVAQLDQDADDFDDIPGRKRETRLDPDLELGLVDALALQVVEHLVDHRMGVGFGGDVFQRDLVQVQLGRVLEVRAQLVLGFLRQGVAAELELPAHLVGRGDATVELHAARPRRGRSAPRRRTGR
jgi:hypothetical protein